MNHNSAQQADLTIIPQAWYNIIKWYDWISIQIHKKANPHRVAALWGFFYAVAVLWVLFLVSIQPFANVVSNYTCFNREKKWYDYLHDSSPPSAYGRRRTAYILYHLTRKSSRIAIKPSRIVSEAFFWFLGKVTCKAKTALQAVLRAFWAILEKTIFYKKLLTFGLRYDIIILGYRKEMKQWNPRN